MDKKSSKKTVKKSNEKNSKTANKSQKKKLSPKAKKTIFIIVAVLILIFIIGAGVLAGIFWTNIKDELFITKEDLTISYQNSNVYDKDGELIATLSGGTKRKCISLSEMGEYLPYAYVAIEDERFYEHSGVDLKRTAAAIVTYVTHGGNSSFGGSSITQQLVKNITNDKEDSGTAGVIRKIKEISKAYQVEQLISKDQILELYLNMIFVGGNDINGVYLGAKYYFNKEPKELSVAECAFMAGINNSPNLYKPFSEDEDKQNTIKKRTKTVLAKMKELGYIKDEQVYEDAVKEVEDGLKFEKGDVSTTNEVSYLVEAALDQIVEDIMEEKNMSRSLAETYVYSGGLKIYTTQETSVQNTLEEVIVKDAYCTQGSYKDSSTGETVKENSTPTMIIMDHSKGYVVAAASATGAKGERTAKTRIGYLNYVTSLKKQTGSSMKPIAVIAPGLESGKINASTMFIDEQTTFEGNYTPKNYYSGFQGAMTMRHAIEISANIPNVKALATIGLETSKAFCQSVGLPEFKNEGLSLALGGLSNGVSVKEMAGAYGAIANDGTYIEPTFYTEVKDKDDNVILTKVQETNKAMSEQNAYITKNILTSVVYGSSGTASYCSVKGMTTAAKTGTTNGDYDRWLCGFTPYYTAVCWYGYEVNAVVKYSGNPAGKIWAEVMKSIHKDLPNAEFVKPEGVITATVCKTSGMIATEGCTETYTEYFTEDNKPAVCDGHQMLMTCTQTNLLCSEGCPFGAWYTYGELPPAERGASWRSSDEVYNGNAPTEYCPHNYGASVPVSNPVIETNNTTTGNTTNSNTTTGNTTKEKTTTEKTTTEKTTNENTTKEKTTTGNTTNSNTTTGNTTGENQSTETNSNTTPTTPDTSNTVDPFTPPSTNNNV